MDKKDVPAAILRYYKATDENLEALETPYIFLFNANEWKDQTELQFEIDISDKVQLRKFIEEVISAQMALPKSSVAYRMYFTLRYNLLNEYRIAEVVSGSAGEKDKVVELLMKKILADPKLQDRKGLIRSNFFSSTGISCFTFDQTSLIEKFHWDAFTIAGTGFCVEYDWSKLMTYFAEKNAGIRGEPVSYYSKKDRPKLILSSSFSQAVVDNYCEIIFSLGQSLKEEKEFRLAKVYPVDLGDKDPLRKQTIPPDAVTSVVMGPDIDSAFQDRVIAAGKKMNKKVKFLKVKKRLVYELIPLNS